MITLITEPCGRQRPPNDKGASMIRFGSIRLVRRGWLAVLVAGVLLAGVPAQAANLVADQSGERYTAPLFYIQHNPPSWGLDRIDQRKLPLDGDYDYGSIASLVTVYVVDSGIRKTHRDFGGRVAAGPDFIQSGGSADDCYGHGTHVAATIGGTRYGVAKGVKLVPLRVFDCNGNGPDDRLVSAVDWITAHAARPAVVNMSLRADAYPDPVLDSAIRRSIAAGITYVVAAGNDDKDACGVSPADVGEAITVGSVDSSDTRAPESNYGRCVDLFAPGVEIPSAGIGSDSSTVSMSGTSMATAHVSGVAALYLQRNPTASPADVEKVLISGATKGVVSDAGAGSPNALVYSGAGVGYPG